MAPRIPTLENLEERLMLSCSCGGDNEELPSDSLNFDTPKITESTFTYETGEETYFNGDTGLLDAEFKAAWNESAGDADSSMGVDEAISAVKLAYEDVDSDGDGTEVNLVASSLTSATVEFTNGKTHKSGDPTVKTVVFNGEKIEEIMPGIILGVDDISEVGTSIDLGDNREQAAHFDYDTKDQFFIGNASNVYDDAGALDEVIAPAGHSDSSMNLEEAKALVKLIHTTDETTLEETYGIVDAEIGCDYAALGILTPGAHNDTDNLLTDKLLISGSEITDYICELEEADEIRELGKNVNLKPKGTREGYIDYSDDKADKRFYGAFIGNPVHFEHLDLGDGKTFKDIQKGNGNGAKLHKVEALALIDCLEAAGGFIGDDSASIELQEGPDGIVSLVFTDYDENGDVRSTNTLHMDF